MPVPARGTMTYLGGRVRGVRRRPPPTSRPSVRLWPGLGSIPTYIQLTCALLVLQTAPYSYSCTSSSTVLVALTDLLGLVTTSSYGTGTMYGTSSTVGGLLPRSQYWLLVRTCLLQL